MTLEQKYNTTNIYAERPIVDDDYADYCIAKTRQIELEYEKKKKMCDDQIKRINDYLIEYRHKVDKQLYHYKSIVSVYAEKEAAKIGKRSITLPSGKIQLPRKSERVIIYDEELIKAQAPGCTRVKIETDKAKLKEKIKSGFVSKGCAIEESVGELKIIPNEIEVLPSEEPKGLFDEN